MEVNSREENNNIESLIEGFKQMGNITKNVGHWGCTEDNGGTAESKESTHQNLDGVEYDSEEFDEYKEEEGFDKKLEKILSSPIKDRVSSSAKVKHVRLVHPKSANSVPTPTRTKSRSSIASTTSSVVRRHPKLNMSFTNDRSREINRDNGILLKKILNASSDKTTTPNPPLRLKSCNASVSRKRQQEQIQHDNLLILKKIQRAKSSNLSLR